MSELRKFSSIIGSLYDCIPDPARWQQTLQALTDHFDGMMATLAVLDSEKNQARFGAYCGDPKMVLPLITTYANEMPFFHLVPKFEIDVPNTMQDLFDLHGPDGRDVFKKTRLYTEWHEGNGVADCLAVLVMRQQGRVGALNIVTSKRRRPISTEDQSRLELLAPHIRRSVVIGDLFELNQRDEQVFKEVIDCFAYAVFVVGENMRLHYANPQAEIMLRDGFAVQASLNALAFKNEMAQAAISKAVTLGERDEVALGTVGIGVPLARVQRPAVAHVLPLARRIEGAQFHSNAIAAIFVATAGQNPVPAIDAIAALFGLTAAEKRVASQVAGGMTRTEISTASGVSDGTIKSQLAAIYDKTGASGQRELELLIRDLTPPVKIK